jgi:hypothetical protein
MITADSREAVQGKNIKKKHFRQEDSRVVVRGMAA